MLFIQIGNYDINMAQVTNIYYCRRGPGESIGKKVIISLAVTDGDGPDTIELYGDEALAFREAWRNRSIPGVTLYKVC